jgi:YggT family protein
MSVIGLIRLVFELYALILLARVLVSWLQVDPYNPLVRLLYQLTEPLLEPIRRILPQSGGLDFSPMVALIVVLVAEQLAISVVASALR